MKPLIVHEIADTLRPAILNTDENPEAYSRLMEALKTSAEQHDPEDISSAIRLLLRETNIPQAEASSIAEKILLEANLN
jgi:hypothetical protein